MDGVHFEERNKAEHKVKQVSWKVRFYGALMVIMFCNEKLLEALSRDNVLFPNSST